MKKRLLCGLLAVLMIFGIIATAPVPANAVTEMTMSQAGIDMVKEFEGYNPEPHWDVSQYSVGWGTRCTEEEIEYYNKYQNGLITEEQAEAKLKEAMIDSSNSVNKFAKRHGIQFTQYEFDALVSLTYNVGGSWTSVSNTSSNLVQSLISGDREYILYAFGLYCKSSSVTSVGHIKRRLLEAQMYFYNIYDYDKGTPGGIRYVYLDGNGGVSSYDTHAFDINFPTQNIRCTFKSKPTGVDKEGNTITYEFAGWFTEKVGGIEITQLDHNLYNGKILYAHWKDPSTGEIVQVESGDTADVTVKVTSTDGVFREGPGKFYTSVRTPKDNEIIPITRTTKGQDGYLWGLSDDGWIRLNYTNYSDVINSGTTDEGTWGTVKVSNTLNVRTGPGTEYDKTGDPLANGTRVLITETQHSDSTDSDWGKIGEDQWISLNYVVLDGEIDHLEDGITVESVTITSLPSQLKVSQGFGSVTPMVSGGKLKLQYSNGTTKTISLSRYMVSGYDDIELGKKTLTVSCAGKTVTYDIEIVEPVFDSISVVANPTKTQYIRKVETLDLTGSRLRLQYSPSGIDHIDITPEMVTGFDNTTLGTNTLTVTYEDKTTTFAVEIVPPEVQTVTVITAPTKTQYVQALETLDVTGGKLQVDYGIAGTEEVDITAEMITGFDNSVVGMNTLTVTYGGKTTTFAVEIIPPTVTEIAVQTKPSKLEYVQMMETLDVTGSKITVTYSNSHTEQVDITAEMVSGFDNATLGRNTITVTYKEKTTTFDVTIVKATVQFLNYDGSVISSTQYAYGETVTPPADPVKPADEYGQYRFVDWDKEIVSVAGNATYTARFELVFAPGDINCDNKVDEDDAIYLLRHVVFPEKYPIVVWSDIDGNGVTDEADAIYLLRHVVFPEKYPLNITE